MIDRLEGLLRGYRADAEASAPPSDPAPPEGLRRAAVAAILRPEGELLFIRRSERHGDPWSGHMAFPGGRMDPVDPSVRATAERETREEVGLDLSQGGRLIGRLTDLHSPVRSGPAAMVISPFVYRLDRSPALSPNHEVADVHWLSFERLARGEGRGSFEMAWMEERWVMPCIDIDGVRIWGLTLRMVDELLERVGAPTSPPPRRRDG